MSTNTNTARTRWIGVVNENHKNKGGLEFLCICSQEQPTNKQQTKSSSALLIGLIGAFEQKQLKTFLLKAPTPINTVKIIPLPSSAIQDQNQETTYKQIHSLGILSPSSSRHHRTIIATSIHINNQPILKKQTIWKQILSTFIQESIPPPQHTITFNSIDTIFPFQPSSSYNTIILS